MWLGEIKEALDLKEEIVWKNLLLNGVTLFYDHDINEIGEKQQEAVLKRSMGMLP